ncbi:cytochrome C [Zoogloea sp.]|uniref:cytochrome C n=1 Tax=Zoogloea sp. TaxID=49181 RepID=UPI00261F8090|nr:cytochrome C [Zoogloea sp.]MDD3353913.1 cytochrome C [Zoogloea sp.]
MKKLCCLLLLGLTLPAWADRLPLPPDTPASYPAECGSCHLAYPPALLAAEHWKRITDTLNRHFGSDASVPAATRQEIAGFLLRHGGNPARIGSAGEPPRITTSAAFQRKHREIDPAFWRDQRVHSAANCEACHTQAAQGRFSEHDIAIRELRH